MKHIPRQENLLFPLLLGTWHHITMHAQQQCWMEGAVIHRAVGYGQLWTGSLALLVGIIHGPSFKGETGTTPVTVKYYRRPPQSR